MMEGSVHEHKFKVGQSVSFTNGIYKVIAFVPLRAVFSDGIHWVAELASKVMRQTSPSSHPSAQRRGTLSPTTEE